ncbi:hypothetical protein ACFV16_37810 [Streptomyces massasporeus]
MRWVLSVAVVLMGLVGLITATADDGPGPYSVVLGAEARRLYRRAAAHS